MNVSYQESILYHDCELIFEAADETGRQYIAVHTGDYETGCEYIIAPATPESVSAFKNGKIDLRRLLLDSPTQEWYTAALDVNDNDVAIALKQKDTPISGCNDLPGTGFYLGAGGSGDMVQEDVQTAGRLPQGGMELYGDCPGQDDQSEPRADPMGTKDQYSGGHIR